MTVALGCVIAALLLLLVLLAVRYRGQDERLGFLERWAAEKDPEAFGIYGRDLEPAEPVRDCEDAGGFHVFSEGSTVCQNCPAEATSLRPS